MKTNSLALHSRPLASLAPSSIAQLYFYNILHFLGKIILCRGSRLYYELISDLIFIISSSLDWFFLPVLYSSITLFLIKSFLDVHNLLNTQHISNCCILPSCRLLQSPDPNWRKLFSFSQCFPSSTDCTLLWTGSWCKVFSSIIINRTRVLQM